MLHSNGDGCIALTLHPLTTGRVNKVCGRTGVFSIVDGSGVRTGESKGWSILLEFAIAFFGPHNCGWSGVGRHLTVHYDFLTMFNFLLRWNRNFWTIQYVKFHFGLSALAQSNVRTANVGPSIFEIGSRD